jgi:hypothetical protein
MRRRQKPNFSFSDIAVLSSELSVIRFWSELRVIATSETLRGPSRKLVRNFVPSIILDLPETDQFPVLTLGEVLPGELRVFTPGRSRCSLGILRRFGRCGVGRSSRFT